MTDTPPQQNRQASALFFGLEGLRPGWGLLLFVFLFALLLRAFSFLTRPFHTAAQASAHQQSPRALFFTEGIALLAVLLATWVLSRTERRSFAAYGLGGARKLPHFAAGLGWGAVLLSLLVLALKLAGLLVFDACLLGGLDILRFGVIWLFGFIIVALLEETLLRGYLQSTLTRGLTSLYGSLAATHSNTLGFWSAAFLLSLLFGLGHGSNPGESPLGLLAATLAGLVFCLSLWRTGSLWWAIGFHASWDWAQSFLYGVANSGTMVQFHFFATHPSGRPILSGGATGPEGSLFVLPILALVAAVILFTLPRSLLPNPTQPIRFES